MERDSVKIYQRIKTQPTRYKEDVHCPLLLKFMIEKGRMSAFCTDILITERTFYNWTKKYPLFGQCFDIGKLYARENWEDEGELIRDEYHPPGVVSNKFEHWKMVGWSRFGISKNARIKVDLNPEDDPAKHYAQLLVQAANGDFTASEIKQLMEAINVGINAHQLIKLQIEIDALRSDLDVMKANMDGNNTVADQGITETDKDSVADQVCQPSS